MSFYMNKRAPREKREAGYPIGKTFAKMIGHVKERMQHTDDNCLFVCFGPTGCGKSTFAFHTANIYNDGQGVDVDLVAFDPASLAGTFAKAKDNKGAFVLLDEANISKRDAMSKYNKSIIDVLFAVRSKNWFLFFNNPDADYLDKALVQGDLVNYFVFIYAKQARFLLFTRKGMQDFLRFNGDLKNETLRRYGKHYAVLDSYFTRYSGDDWTEYLSKKNARVDNKLDEFIKEFGNDKERFSTTEVGEMFGVHKQTVLRHLNKIDDAEFIADAKNVTGQWKLTREHIDYLRDFIAGNVTNVASAPHIHKTCEGESLHE